MNRKVILCELLLLQMLQALACVAGNRVDINIQLRSHRNATRHRLMSAQLRSAGVEDQEVALNVSLAQAARPDGLYLLTLGAETSVHGGSAFLDYQRLEGAPGLYKLHRRAASWIEAVATCAGEGAQLLVPESAAEAQAAIKLLLSLPAPPGVERNNFLYVGLSDADKEGEYVTVTGKKMSELDFRTWSNGQPNKGREQNWVAIYEDGKYHDIPVTWKLSFMCRAL